MAVRNNDYSMGNIYKQQKYSVYHYIARPRMTRRLDEYRHTKENMYCIYKHDNINMVSAYVLREMCNKGIECKKTKQQLCLKASQKTERCTLLELSAASSAGKNDVNQKKRHIHLKKISLPHTNTVWGQQTTHVHSIK